ncbi:hypothetical protein [Streptosporangium sp. NPDC023615]|uniref:hypothetical protein n=1 Tax=Streptosporangium sp. NPDC023615 TaxID=3154794 RepID=UPI00343DDC0A
MTETEAVIEALSRRAPVPGPQTPRTSRTPDAAIALLAALADDVDQRCSSVSITPST